ncbi:hypothetical protein [Reichenbachiella ulvae]|uniref:Uncharacterized protein n=1 Tax=Reichenbachiella ulvae TaxID=2980104 RepID=A0ABT3CTU1_9BACT|nr:hypothetical protein [Reichenbachiella ulvae]MCV9387001.1 hypothetical protein [Reichenbachiella ulvae]
MNYFKWHSDDNTIILEKFRGDFTTEFLELSEKYLVDFSEFDQVKLISDVRLANFSKVAPGEAARFASNFIRTVPASFPLELCFVLGEDERDDMDVITSYAEPISSSINIDFKLLRTMDEVKDQLNIDSESSKKMNQAIDEWLKTLS